MLEQNKSGYKDMQISFYQPGVSNNIELHRLLVHRNKCIFHLACFKRHNQPSLSSQTECVLSNLLASSICKHHKMEACFFHIRNSST